MGAHGWCWKGGNGSPQVSWVQTVGKVLAAPVSKSQPPLPCEAGQGLEWVGVGVAPLTLAQHEGPCGSGFRMGPRSPRKGPWVRLAPLADESREDGARSKASLVRPRRAWPQEDPGRHRGCRHLMASATRWTSEEQREELTAPPPRRETQYKAMLENFKYRIKIQSVRHHRS